MKRTKNPDENMNIGNDAGMNGMENEMTSQELKNLSLVTQRRLQTKGYDVRELGEGDYFFVNYAISAKVASLCRFSNLDELIDWYHANLEYRVGDMEILLTFMDLAGLLTIEQQKVLAEDPLATVFTPDDGKFERMKKLIQLAS